MSTAFLIGTVAILAAACEQSPVADLGDGGLVASMDIVDGQGQEGPWGEELSQPLVVRVLDSRGHGVRDQLVNFRVVEGGGTMWAGATVSDRNGYAQDYWTLGLPGAQTVEARAVDPTTGQKLVFATFTALATGDGPPPPPSSDLDGDGYTVADGDCRDDNAAIHPGAVDQPDDLLLDSNCDGVDGDLQAAVLVSASLGGDTGSCGTVAEPCRTIGFGIQQAVALGRIQVYIAQGTYAEGISLADGVSLYGGYDPFFTVRDPVTLTASIAGSTPYGPEAEPATVLAVDLTVPLELMDLEVKGLNATGYTTSGQGKSSFAVVVKNVAQGILTIRRTRITSGNASNGQAGAAGSSASQSAAASGGAGGPGNTYSTACNNTSRGQGGSAAGTGPTAGGQGGAGGTMDTDCTRTLGGLGPYADLNATSGLAGSTAVTWSGSYGLGGAGGNATTCAPGADGRPGLPGNNGSHGSGGQASGVTNGRWWGGNGGSGQLGTIGGGGGGGGGAGGCDTNTDSYGAGGGGGGAGGVAATSAGQGGFAGGGSFGVFVLDASVRIEWTTFTRGVAGNGGRGGNGGLGQPGGAGGNGGAAGDPDAGPGGNGGDGGRGGNAGAGGGGMGGISAGVYHFGTGSINESGNTFGGGSGGAGGQGGQSGASSASPGAAGQVYTVVIG